MKWEVIGHQNQVEVEILRLLHICQAWRFNSRHVNGACTRGIFQRSDVDSREALERWNDKRRYRSPEVLVSQQGSWCHRVSRGLLGPIRKTQKISLRDARTEDERGVSVDPRWVGCLQGEPDRFGVSRS